MAPTLVTGRKGEIVTIPSVPTRIKRLRPVERAEEESTYMPSARAETQPAAMGTAVRAWRLNTASRLQPGDRKNDVSSCLLNPELRQVARNRESSERAALFYGRVGKYTA